MLFVDKNYPIRYCLDIANNHINHRFRDVLQRLLGVINLLFYLPISL